MLRKRRREGQEPADASQIVTLTLKRCRTWKDTCGKPFHVRSRDPEVGVDRLTLRVGRFDRLRCCEVLAVRGAGPEERHAVSGFDAVLPRGEVIFHVTRQPRPGDGADAEQRQPQPSPAVRYEERPPALAHVLAEDTIECTEAARALLRHFPQARVEVRRRPETYDLAAEGVPSVPHAAAAALARWPASYIDFERGALVAVVPRKKPDV
jgi:hypothetical protein